MIILELEDFRNKVEALKNRFDFIDFEIEEASEIAEIENNVFRRNVRELKFVFSFGFIEEETGVSEFDILTAYYNAIDNEFVLECMEDKDTKALKGFFESK